MGIPILFGYAQHIYVRLCDCHGMRRGNTPRLRCGRIDIRARRVDHDLTARFEAVALDMQPTVWRHIGAGRKRAIGIIVCGGQCHTGRDAIGA